MLAGHTTHTFGALSLGIRKYSVEDNQLDILPSVSSFLLVPVSFNVLCSPSTSPLSDALLVYQSLTDSLLCVLCDKFARAALKLSHSLRSLPETRVYRRHQYQTLHTWESLIDGLAVVYIWLICRQDLVASCVKLPWL